MDAAVTSDTWSASNLFSVAGKSVLITGGSRGIGLMMATVFVANGAKVYITSRKADVVAEAATGLGRLGHCVGIPADIANPSQQQELLERLSNYTDRLDVLVNNAGATWGAPLAEYPEAAFDKLWATNVKSVFNLTRGLLPHLRAAASKENPARVINIGSVEGIRGSSNDNFAYPATKAAVHMLTRQLALSLAREHININAIAPGFFPTKMTATWIEAEGDKVKKWIPIGRHGRLEDIAGAAIYLSSRASAYITGEILSVDGGLAAR